MGSKKLIAKALLVVSFLFLMTIAFSTNLLAGDELVLYCSTPPDWCNLMVKEFEKETGINVKMTRKSTGEFLAEIKAEAKRPKGDIWWGGTGDPHLQAAEEDLTVPYTSPLFDHLQPWAQTQAKISGMKTVGIYSGAIGWGYNTELMAEKGLPVPKCWKDLIKPIYKGEIQISNPNSSGTAYTVLATVSQLFGEKEGFKYLQELHKNVNQYTKSGSAPIKAAARGETAIGIVFMHLGTEQMLKGMPIAVQDPCEGTGYEVGSMSIIKGGPNPDIAKKYYDFALRPDIQTKLAKITYEAPSNVDAEIPPEAPDLTKMKLINYDFKKYGASDTRKRLLQKWDKEVGSLPR